MSVCVVVVVVVVIVMVGECVCSGCWGVWWALTAPVLTHTLTFSSTTMTLVFPFFLASSSAVLPYCAQGVSECRMNSRSIQVAHASS